MSRKLVLRLRCGSCQYLDGIKHPKLEAPCTTLGKLTTTPACDLYDADYSSNRADPMDIANIGKIIKDLPDTVKHAIAYAIINGGELERASQTYLGFKLQLGQPCYVNLGGADFLNCWFKAYAIGVTKGVKGIILYSPSDSDRPVFVIKSLTHAEDILSIKQFKAHVKDMVKSKRINAPTGGRRSILTEHLPKLPTKIDAENYKPQMIGSVDTSVLQHKNNNAMAGKKSIGEATTTRRRDRIEVSPKSNVKVTKARSGTVIEIV